MPCSESKVSAVSSNVVVLQDEYHLDGDIPELKNDRVTAAGPTILLCESRVTTAMAKYSKYSHGISLLVTMTK